MTYSTKELCDALGVSRAWVNEYMRDLGDAPAPDGRDLANARTVYYDEKDVLRWINSTACFSRQTRKVDFREHLHGESLDRYEAAGEQVRKRMRSDGFLAGALPPQLLAACGRLTVRSRGTIPWVVVDHKVGSLTELHTMRSLQALWNCRNSELVYREIFRRSLIRVEIMGRVWYTEGPAPDQEYAITIPADYT